MAKYELPNSNFIPHPNGTFEGRIVGVEDKGEVDTNFGRKRKLAIKIESATEMMDDGNPFSAWLWHTLSGSPKSNLYKLRASLLGRALTAEERAHFEDGELVGRRVGYQIVHQEGSEGGVFANVENVWPLNDTAPQPVLAAATDEASLPF